MRQFVEVAIFWAAVFAGICLVSRFPESWLGRILFARQGPLPIRGQPRSRYFMRWAIYAAGWFVQAAFVFLIGWEAQRINPALGEELVFKVFWMAVVPLLATVALVASLLALTASLWRRYLGAERRKRATSHVLHT